MSKCIGCGVNLQTINKDKIGYTISLNNELCERCFRIRNYNDYKFIRSKTCPFILSDLMKKSAKAV